MSRRARIIEAVVAALAVIGATVGIVIALNGPAQKTLTAYFPQTIGIYSDSSVRILGVQVGTVTKIVPDGRQVKVVMTYDANDKLPANVDAAIVVPSVVSDRYIQLTPVYTGGPVLPNHAVLPASRTEIPLELDQIYQEFNKINVALGPHGANRDGALSKLIRVSAANLAGNGGQFHTTIVEFAQFIQTLSSNRGNFFGMLRNLEQFTSMLAHDNGGVKAVTGQLAVVSTQLFNERKDLGLALQNLAVALGQVGNFVRDNRAELTKDISGLTDVTSALLTQKRSIIEFLDDAPTALTNLALTYDPASHTLRTRDNITQAFTKGSLKSLVCGLLKQLHLRCPKKLKLPGPSLPGGASGGAGSGAGSLPGRGSQSVRKTLQQLFGGGL
jgi:phospholipid/cholesterol/gamma-HCH transport system substrate-binding protein